MTATIATAADRIATILDITADEALTLATTYAIQLDVSTGTQEGGQAPGVEIDADTLDHIVNAATAAAELNDR